jgi:phosphate transport system substrate-binding protein
MAQIERRRMRIRRLNTILLLAVVAALLAVVAAGCGGDEEEAAPPAEPAPAETTAPPAEPAPAETTEPAAELSGSIEADGSSTVGPLTTAAAELFGEENPGVVVTVGISGTGGGFERFCAGETDISNASRPIKEDEEVPICQENGIEYIEIPVAVDALTVVVSPENDWAACLTVDQLKTIWEPAAEGKVTNWNQVDPSFPDQPLVLAGAGTDSGTFDYFTDAIVGEEGASRADYTASEDDNVTVQAVAGDKGALGYFGYSYLEQNLDKLKAVEIDGGAGCVAPSPETAQSGEYTPLSRPLFIYVKKESFQRPEVQAFVQYYLENIDTIAETALFIPPTEEERAEAQAAVETAIAEAAG